MVICAITHYQFIEEEISVGHYLRDLQDIGRVKVFSEATEKTREYFCFILMK